MSGKQINHTTKWITWQEAMFFFVFFVVFQFISAIQYSVTYNDRENFYTTSIYFGVSSILNIIPYLFYYKAIVPRFLFRHRYALFIVALLLFLVAFDLYIRYVIDFGVSKISFLPDKVQQMAANIFKRHDLPRQSITYTLSNLLGVTALAYFMRTRQKENEVHYLQQQQLTLELNALKSQLHPHFFFNTLNNIYSLALQQSPSTSVVVRKLADMMRYMLYETGEAMTHLQKEINFISDYVALEKIRHDNNTRISFDFQGEAGNHQIEPFLLLPFVENAFKHGLDQETGQGFVEITMMLHQHELVLQVRNSKPAIAADATTNAKGLGLENVRKRLLLLYSDRHEIKITEESNLYQVYLTLTLHK